MKKSKFMWLLGAIVLLVVLVVLALGIERTEHNLELQAIYEDSIKRAEKDSIRKAERKRVNEYFNSFHPLTISQNYSENDLDFRNYSFIGDIVAININLPTYWLTLKNISYLKQIILEKLYGSKTHAQLEIVDIYKYYKKTFDDYHYPIFIKEETDKDYDSWLEQSWYHEVFGNYLLYNNNILVYNKFEQWSGKGYNHGASSSEFFMIDLTSQTIITEDMLFNKKDFDKISDLFMKQLVEDMGVASIDELEGRGWDRQIQPNGNCYLDYDESSNDWYMVWQYQRGEVAWYGFGDTQIKIEISKLKPYLKMDVMPYLSSEDLHVNEKIKKALGL